MAPSWGALQEPGPENRYFPALFHCLTPKSRRGPGALQAIYRRAFLLGNICLLSPGLQSPTVRRCWVAKIDSHSLLPGCLSPTLRGNCTSVAVLESSRRKGTALGRGMLTCPGPLRHCTACLWVRPQRLTPSTWRSLSPGEGAKLLHSGAPAKPRPTPARSLRSAEGRGAWSPWVSKTPCGPEHPAL